MSDKGPIIVPFSAPVLDALVTALQNAPYKIAFPILTEIQTAVDIHNSLVAADADKKTE